MSIYSILHLVVVHLPLIRVKFLMCDNLYVSGGKLIAWTIDDLKIEFHDGKDQKVHVETNVCILYKYKQRIGLEKLTFKHTRKIGLKS